MTCINCGSAFHEKWACTKPLKVAEEAISTAALREVQPSQRKSVATVATAIGGKSRAGESELEGSTAEASVGSLRGVTPSSVPAGQSLPPVDTTPKRGRPKTITDMRTYKANKAKQYRASKRLGK